MVKVPSANNNSIGHRHLHCTSNPPPHVSDKQVNGKPTNPNGMGYLMIHDANIYILKDYGRVVRLPPELTKLRVSGGVRGVVGKQGDGTNLRCFHITHQPQEPIAANGVERAYAEVLTELLQLLCGCHQT